MGGVKVIGASAGSGKTYRLAYEWVRSVVADPSLYRRILAVTFTNKATEEMRGRILERLHELAAGQPSPYLEALLRDLPAFDEVRLRARAAEVQRLILHDYSRFAVLTIDRFFQRLIRGFIRELGVELNYNLELETDSLLEMAADALIADSASEPELQRRLFALAGQHVAEGKRWDIREPLVELGKELFGEGFRPASEGATSLIETLAERARVSENPRLAASVGLLRENHRNFMLLSDLQQRIERLCREESIVPIAETNRMIARLVEGNDAPFIFEKAGSYFTRFYIDEFQDTSAAQWENFVPLLHNAIASEEGDPVILIGDIKQAIYRWRGGDWQILSRRVREEFGADRVEVESLETNYRSLPRVVEFNNRAVGLVVEAENRELNQMVNKALAEGAIDGPLAEELTDLLAEAYRGHTQKPATRSTENAETTAEKDAPEGYVTLTLYGKDDDGRYTPPVIEKVEELQSRGFAAGDIAVLVRGNAQGAEVARMLLAHKHANPSSPYVYDVITSEALTVGASATSRFLIACLTLATTPDDSIQRAIYNRYLRRDFGAPLAAAADLLAEPEADFFARLRSLGPEDAFEEIVLRFGLADRADEIAYIQALHQQIVTFSARHIADIPLFLKWWNERGASASITMQGRANAITITTIHKAKGLEYKAVVVPYLNWRMAPDTRGHNLVVWAEGTAGEGAEELAELGPVPLNYKKAMADSHFASDYYREQVLAHIDALNLFYVAVTRAEAELHLMSSLNPYMGKNAIGNVLCGALGVKTGKGAMEGEVLAYGKPVHPEPTADPATATLKTYTTTRPGSKVRLRIASSQVDFGITMHRALETAANEAELEQALERLPDQPQVREWFDVAAWDEIHTEGNILRPGAATGRRPDRVMIRGGRAVVVDYKFGRAQRRDYATQVREYVRLLGEMGYTQVEGYIWYVTLDKIEAVV